MVFHPAWNDVNIHKFHEQFSTNSSIRDGSLLLNYFTM